MQGIQHEAAQCEKVKAGKAEAALDSTSSEELCPKYSSELKAALTKYTLAVERCANAQFATLRRPEIGRLLPVPGIDFNLWEFTGDVAPSRTSMTEEYTLYSKILRASQKAEARKRIKKQDERVRYLQSTTEAVDKAFGKYVEQKPELEKALAEARSAVLDHKQQACEAACLLEAAPRVARPAPALRRRRP